MYNHAIASNTMKEPFGNDEQQLLTLFKTVINVAVVLI